MRLKRSSTTFLLVLCAGCLPIVAQGFDPQPDGASNETSHALRHFEQLSRLIDVAAPNPELRKKLDHLIIPHIRANFSDMASDETLPMASRSVAKRLSQTAHVDSLAKVVAAQPAFEALSRQDSGAGFPIASSDITMFQVITPELPAGAIRASIPAGFANIDQCKSEGGLFPRLQQEMNQRANEIRELANSVGRIEVKAGANIPALDGTGFVVDQEHGLIATACHVAYEIADYDATGKTWIVPASQFVKPSVVLIDFGSTDDHDPKNEFTVTRIAFVPGTSGCDGALLQVDTSSKRLPPALPLAATNPPAGAASILDVFSVGYPSRNLSGATADSQRYFTCIRSADPVSAKFVFGGEVTEVEVKSGYDILAHIVPTVGGQSGSPVVQLSSDGKLNTVGIHICCTTSAQQDTGPACELRSEPYLQEAVSIVDLMSLAKASGLLATNSRSFDERTVYDSISDEAAPSYGNPVSLHR